MWITGNAVKAAKSTYPLIPCNRAFLEGPASDHVIYEELGSGARAFSAFLSRHLESLGTFGSSCGLSPNTGQYGHTRGVVNEIL